MCSTHKGGLKKQQVEEIEKIEREKSKAKKKKGTALPWKQENCLGAGAEGKRSRRCIPITNGDVLVDAIVEVIG